MLQFYHDSFKSGRKALKPTIEFLYNTFSQFASHSEWKELITTLPYNKSKVIAPLLITGHLRFKDMDSIDKIEEEMKSIIWKKHINFKQIMTRYIKRQEYEQCLIFGDLLQYYTIDSITPMLFSCLKLKKIDEYYKLRDIMNNNGLMFGADQMNLLFPALLNLDMEEIIVEEWKVTRTTELPNSTLNLLIQAHARLHLFDQCLLLLDSMKTKGFTPDCFMYTTLIKYYAEKNRFAHIEKLINEMKTNGIKMDIKFYEIMSKVYIQKEDYKRLDQILSEVRAAKFKSNRFYTNLLIQYAKVYDRTRYNETIEYIESNDFKMDEDRLKVMVDVVLETKWGGYKDILKLEIENGRVLANGKICAAGFVRAYSMLGEHSRARDCWTKYADNHGLYANQKAVFIGLHSVLRADDVLWLNDIAKNLVYRSLDETNHLLLIECFCRFELWENASERVNLFIKRFDIVDHQDLARNLQIWFAKAKDEGLKEQIRTLITQLHQINPKAEPKDQKTIQFYDQLLQTYIKDVDNESVIKDVDFMLEQMQDHKMPLQFYTDLINLYFTKHDFNRVNRILKTVENLTPNIEFFNNLMSKYSQFDSMKSEYDNVLLKLKQAGLVPNKNTFIIMLDQLLRKKTGCLDIDHLQVRDRALIIEGKLCPSVVVQQYSFQLEHEKAKLYWKEFYDVLDLYSDDTAVSIAINAAGKAEDREWLDQVCDKLNLESLTQENYNSLIDGYCRVEDYREAIRYIKKFSRFKRLEDYSKTVGTITEGFAYCRDIETLLIVKSLLAQFQQQPRM